MNQPTDVLRLRGASVPRLIGLISAAHFVSHYYILLLPPLFSFVRAEYGVSYTELGYALTAFYAVSAVLQTPAGFLVDWLGARILLIAGLLVGALAFAVAGLVHSFWILVAMFGLAGIGNTVYHPADYALLSEHVSSKHTAWAFSIHTFAGTIGYAVAPGSLLLMQNYWGWRGAFIGASLLGFTVAALLIVQINELTAMKATDRSPAAETATGWQLLLVPPILLNLVFFVLFAVTVGGLQNYSIVALGALHGTPPAISNAALTGYLLLSSIGILVGGSLAARTTRHGLVAAVGLLGMAAFAALIMLKLDDIILIAAMSTCDSSMASSCHRAT